MMTVKCIKNFIEKGRDGKEYLYKRGCKYAMTLNGYYVIGTGDSQVTIRNRQKFYKHFIII